MLALWLLLCAGLPAGAQEKTLRVGYMDYSGFIEQQSDGTYSGYGAEYLAKISGYTGYRYEYVYGKWSDLLDMLANRQIDLICMVQYTKERAERFDYTAYPIGYTQGLLYGAPDCEIAYEDFKAFNSIRVGVLHDNAIKRYFDEYQRLHGFSCGIVEYEYESDMMRALNKGIIEAMCSEHLANHKGLSLLAKFGADAFYIISYKGSPYVEEINAALRQIKTDVDFEAELFHKYYDSSAAETTLLFTTAEKAFIAGSKPLKVAFNGDRAPFAKYDARKGTFSGICVDVMNEIAAASGLTFEYVLQTPGVKTSDMIGSGQFDIVCGVERDNFVTNPDIVSTNAFLESANVPVGKAGRALSLSDPLTVAIPASFQALQKSLETHYPHLKIVGYTLNQEGLDAVVAGKADVFVQNTHLLSLLLQRPRYSGLAILPVDVMEEHTALALSRNADPLLLSVLDKSIENLNAATVSASLIAHTFASPYKYTMGDFFYRFRPQFAVIGVLIALCFVLMGLVILTKQRSAQRLQIVNRSLEHAVAKADSANAAKSQFLAQMSHEIRTPMNAIIGLTGIAQTEIRNPEKIKDYLTKIDGSSRLLLGIINDVLDMSAIEGGKLKIDRAPFNLKQMLTGITTVFYQQSRMKNIDFHVRMNGVTEEMVVGDELRVNQILMNLLSNAVKFTPPGGEIDLIVLQASRSHDKVQFRFSVSDTGCGMSQDMMSRLFKPFEQESASVARKHGGSGLGLSITKNLVEMMGGKISVESVAGKGSVFMADIPFGACEQAYPTKTTGFSGIRALVVDDDRESCEYCGILLDRLGVRHEYVTDGEAALEMMGDAEDKGDPFTLCLVDWKMPDMDGMTVTRRIREIFGEETVVIIVTAYDLNEAEASGKAAGADYFIGKPLFQSTLFNALMRISGGDYTKIEAGQEKDKYDFTGKRVLVAEDVPLNMEVAVTLLNMVGAEAACAEDGRKAVDIFETSQPGSINCILLDINMPVMDGYEAARAIRRSGKADAATVPIFAMTANAFSQDIAAALSAGMNGHIAKPVEAKVLYQTLASVFCCQRQDG